MSVSERERESVSEREREREELKDQPFKNSSFVVPPTHPRSENRDGESWRDAASEIPRSLNGSLFF